MKRRAEHLVSKRDGRREWLRATKLARSLAAALEATGEGDPQGVAFQLASVVLEALRRRAEMDAGPADDSGSVPRLTTADIASAAERALWVSGRPEAAVRYAGVRDERTQRVSWLAVERSRLPVRRTGLRPRATFDHN